MSFYVCIYTCIITTQIKLLNISSIVEDSLLPYSGQYPTPNYILNSLLID